MRRLLLLILLSCQLFGYAQDRLVDSVMNAPGGDSLKIGSLNALFLKYEFVDQAIAEACLKKALSLCNENTSLNLMATTRYHSGYLAEDKGNYPEALKYYYDAMQVWEKMGDEMQMADASFCIGNVYYLLENYTEALNRYSAAMEVYKKKGSKQSIGNACNNIGGVYMHQGNYAKAIEKYTEGLKIRQELGDRKGVGDSYVNIGNVYSQQKQNDTALSRYFEGLKIMEELGRKVKLPGVYSNIGIVYLNMKRFPEARDYLDRSLRLGLEYGIRETVRNTYKGLAELDSAQGNFGGAIANYKKYILYRDSLDNEETRNRTVQEQLTYEFEKKEAVAQAKHKKELESNQEIAEEKDRKQMLILGAVVFLLLLVVAFAVFAGRSLRLTKRQKDSIEAQKKLVEDQKRRVEEQKTVIEEKQKEIIDSITYAKRIQRSLMPTEPYIQQMLNKLKRT